MDSKTTEDTYITDPQTTKRMRQVKRRDTGPELEVRRLLYHVGMRYRVDYKPPGLVKTKVDIAFLGARVAVFIDGCFWHGCPEHGSRPRRNRHLWVQKIERNRARDLEVVRELERLGWLVVRRWEHEEAVDVANDVVRIVRTRSRLRLFKVTGSRRRGRSTSVEVDPKVGSGLE